MSDLFADERAASPVGTKTLFKSRRKRNLVLMAAGGGAAIFVIMGINAALNLKERSKPDDTGANAISQVTPGPPIPPVGEPPAVVPAAPPHAPPAIVATPSSDYVRFPAVGGEAYFSVAAKPVREVKPVQDGDPAPAERDGKTAVAFKSGILIGGKAGPAIRLTYVMLPQLIPCILDTAMDSNLAGAIMCHTSQDVLSPDHVLLMPAGTNIVGTYKNDVANGQHRLFAFAGNAITKEGIPVPLDSAVADGVGRAGIEGEVDHHYGEKFGAAILLALADSALSVAQTEVSKRGQTNLNINGGGSGLGGVANQILQSQINIPPTIYVQPGTQISIAVDHPVSFEDALRVSTAERGTR